MRNRNYFLNRVRNSNENILKSNIPFKKRRQSDILQKTCANWQPQEAIPKDQLQLMKYKQNYMKTLFINLLESQSIVLIKPHMKDCFHLQRQFLNNMKPVPSEQEIQANWPYIFNEQCLHQNFKQLMNIDAKIFWEIFKQSQEKFWLFLSGASTKTVKNNSDCEIPEEMEIVFNIIKYFGEHPDYLSKNFEVELTLNDIRNNIPTNTPFIGFTKCDIQGITRAYIFIEKVVVNEYLAEKNFLKMLAQVINYYFVFNIMYPAEISQSMKFFVRLCYKYYPNYTRGSKKNINNLQKVNSLISKITNIQ